MFGVDQRTHLYPFLRRVANSHFFQPGDQRLADGLHLRLRHDDAANGGTFLSGFGRHLPHNFADKQGKFRLLRGDVIPQHAAVQGVGLHGEGNRTGDDVRMYAQHLAGDRGAGKGHHVLAVELVEQIPRAAADQADGAVRHQAAVDNRFHHRLGDLGGGGGRFDDGRHPRQPGRGQFFQHSPAREVKGVDMDGHPGFRGQDVTGGKTTLFRQGDQFIFRPQGIVRQFTTAEAGEGEEGADPALDIHPAVGAGRPGLGREGIEHLFLAQQMFCHRFQHRGALDEGHGVKGFTAFLNGVTTRGGHIQPFAGDLPEGFAADGMLNSALTAPARLPGAGQKAG